MKSFPSELSDNRSTALTPRKKAPIDPPLIKNILCSVLSRSVSKETLTSSSTVFCRVAALSGVHSRSSLELDGRCTVCSNTAWKGATRFFVASQLSEKEDL